MKIEEVRKRFLAFMESKGHTVIESASVVPQDDGTTLFTGSGMQPLIPYLLGKKHPKGVRLANSQKCFRANDIDELGDILRFLRCLGIGLLEIISRKSR